MKVELTQSEVVLIRSGLSDYQDRIEKMIRKEPKRRKELKKIWDDAEKLNNFFRENSYK